jgi:hypothetical protein
MHIFSKINLRRICAICLISVTLFMGSVIGIGHQDQAFAEVLKRNALGVSGEEQPLNDAEYESAKARRSQLQAERSKQAKEEADSESVPEKLNLGEITPPAIENALEDKK